MFDGVSRKLRGDVGHHVANLSFCCQNLSVDVGSLIRKDLVDTRQSACMFLWIHAMRYRELRDGVAAMFGRLTDSSVEPFLQ